MRGGNGQCGFLDAALIEAARAGKDLDEGKAALARVIGYEAPNRGGDGKAELIALITTRTDPRTPRPAARARIPRKVGARDRRRPVQNPPDRPGPGAALQSPDMVRQEIYGYLLTHHAISALICQAATEADIDPDRVKFTRTVRIVRRAAGPAFPP